MDVLGYNIGSAAIFVAFLLGLYLICAGLIAAYRIARRKIHGPNSTQSLAEKIVVVKNGKPLFRSRFFRH